jgi:predicted phosphodiesterase
MRLRIFSDLHLEFADFEPPAVAADVVVLAGDIGLGTEGVEWAAQHFHGTDVIYVPGNHEAFGSALPVFGKNLRAFGARCGVHVLDQEAVSLHGIRFLGCTLWTDFQLQRDGGLAASLAEDYFADFYQIRVSPSGRRLCANDVVGWHRRGLAWLEKQMEISIKEPTVIVTHHAPSRRSLRAQYASELSSAAFASDLEAFVALSGAAVWVHGHTHYCTDYELGATRVVSNQRGYPNEGVERFNSEFTIDVG